MSKNIIILLDGTWNNRAGKDLTNIGKLSLELTCISQPNQIVYYDEGVGTETRTMIYETMEDPVEDIFERLRNNFLKKADKILGGATGAGLSENIMQAYHFLCKNYEVGDKLFIFGFSRGAFTARSLAGLIRKAGILRTGKETTGEQVIEAYELYRRDDVKPSDTEPKNFRLKNSYPVDVKNEAGEIKYETRVHFLGVFDTVGALGIPDSIYNDSRSEKIRFHDVTLSGMIETARHAIAIDEHREDFAPTLWDAQSTTNSEQRWFSGAHSDVGGSYPDHAAADIARRWMWEEARSKGLNIPDITANPGLLKDKRIVYAPQDKLGSIHDSRYYLFGPMRIFRVASQYVRPLGTKADEVVDPSVIKRIEQNKSYRPKNSFLTSHNFKISMPSNAFTAARKEEDFILEEPNKCTVM